MLTIGLHKNHSPLLYTITIVNQKVFQYRVVEGLSQGEWTCQEKEEGIQEILKNGEIRA